MMSFEQDFPRRRAADFRHAVMVALTVCGTVVFAATASAQRGDDHYHPLSQHSPPGQAAAWLNYLRKYDPSWLQPLQIEVPGGGTVEVFSGCNVPVAAATSPALVAAGVGHLYRLRISNMPHFPDVEIFPTIELLDRLHPPAGRENDFPVPIILTESDIATGMRGQLVTRVVYLEQPQLAQVVDPLRREIPQAVTPSENALKEADRLGRPMAIIRIGGRQPSPASPASFFGTGGAVQIRQLAPADAGEGAAVVRMSGGPVRPQQRQNPYPRR